MKNLLFNIKAVPTDSYKVIVGAGAEINSFGSAPLFCMPAQSRPLQIFLAGHRRRENERRHRHSGIHRHNLLAEQKMPDSVASV